jgi:hypothetical protein
VRHAAGRCIGIWETNRGGDAPNPRDSSLDTVAGVTASMATIGQATMPDALRCARWFSAVALKETIDAEHAEIGPKKWGENRAAWQRLAVQNMPNDVGGRINAVATSSGGAALAGPVIRARVDAQLAKQPQPSEEALVKAVGAANNPHETGYGDNIWATYQRLY